MTAQAHTHVRVFYVVHQRVSRNYCQSGSCLIQASAADTPVDSTCHRCCVPAECCFLWWLAAAGFATKSSATVVDVSKCCRQVTVCCLTQRCLMGHTRLPVSRPTQDACCSCASRQPPCTCQASQHTLSVRHDPPDAATQLKQLFCFQLCN